MPEESRAVWKLRVDPLAHFAPKSPSFSARFPSANFGRHHAKGATVRTDEDRAAEDHENRVNEAVKAFRLAAGPDCAWYLGHAAYMIGSGRGSIRLSDADRILLLKALEFAKASALADLPATISREDVLRGVAALVDQIEFWSQTSTQRAEWGDEKADMSARGRIFRNALHNVDLELGIAKRAEARRAAIIANLRQLGVDVVIPPIKRRGVA